MRGWLGHLAAWVTAVALLAPVATLPASAEPLVVGVEEVQLWPYARPDDERVFVGYLRELLDAFARDRGHELTYELAPLKRLLLGLGGQEMTLFVPDNPSWSVESKQGIELHYTTPVAIALDGFAVLPGREDEVPGQGIHNIGAILGFTLEPLFTATELELLTFDRASGFESLFRALLLGRVDAVHCNLAVADQVLHTLGHPPSVVSWSQGLPRLRSTFHFSSQNAELIAEIDAWMLANPETVDRLRREYGLADFEKRPWGDATPVPASEAGPSRPREEASLSPGRSATPTSARWPPPEEG